MARYNSMRYDIDALRSECKSGSVEAYRDGLSHILKGI